jgi:hypothetical protein
VARRCRWRAIEWGRARAAARLIEMAGVIAVTRAARSREGPLPGHARDDRDFQPGVRNRCAGCSSTAGGASPPARRGARVHQPRPLAGHAGQPPGQHHRPRQPWQLEEGRVEGLEPLVAVGSVGAVNLERPGERGRLAEELLVEVVADLPIAWATSNAGVAASREGCDVGAATPRPPDTDCGGERDPAPNPQSPFQTARDPPPGVRDLIHLVTASIARDIACKPNDRSSRAATRPERSKAKKPRLGRRWKATSCGRSPLSTRMRQHEPTPPGPLGSDSATNDVRTDAIAHGRRCRRRAAPPLRPRDQQMVGCTTPFMPSERIGGHSD